MTIRKVSSNFLPVTYLPVVSETEPAHVGWLEVVFVMSLNVRIAADFAGLLNQLPGSNSTVNHVVSPGLFWMRRSPTLLCLLDRLLPLRLLEPLVFVIPILLPFVSPVASHVGFAALLTLPKQTVTHRRVRVELAAGFFLAALEASLVHARDPFSSKGP
jgi:hypothetical protein